MGVPGDSLSILNGVLYVNGEKAFKGEHQQKSYRIIFKPNLNVPQEFLTDQGINLMDFEGRNLFQDNQIYMVVNMDDATAAKLEKNPSVERVEPIYKGKMKTPDNPDYIPLRYYPHDPELQLNSIDEFGPIWVPEKGVTVEINEKNYPFYQRIIEFMNTIRLRMTARVSLYRRQETDLLYIQTELLLDDGRQTGIVLWTVASDRGLFRKTTL